MAKMTVKYSAAVRLALSLKVSPSNDQGVMYGDLEGRGYQWDSKKGEWIRLLDVPANKPSGSVNIRLWADLNDVDGLADDLEQAMRRCDLRLLKRSQVYVCRPPQQLEGRVYMLFVKRDEVE